MKADLSFSHSDTRRRYNRKVVPWLLDPSAAIVGRRKVGVPSSVIVLGRFQIFVIGAYITLRRFSWFYKGTSPCVVDLIGEGLLPLRDGFLLLRGSNFY